MIHTSTRILRPELLDAYRSHLIHEEKSPATVDKYLRDVRAFAAYAGGRPITRELCAAWKAELRARGYAPRSVNSILASLNSLLGCLGWTDCRVKSLRLQRQIYCAESRELTRGEYLRLLQACRGKPQLRLILQTICATGIRVSELHAFTAEAIAAGEVTLSCKNKTRRILIPGKLGKLLRAYAQSRGIRSGELFLSATGRPLHRSRIWAMMKHLCRAAGVAASKVFPHNLRKLFARTFYQMEKDIAKLADVLGHSSIETTRIYIMTSGSEHRKTIDRLGLVV